MTTPAPPASTPDSSAVYYRSGNADMVTLAKKRQP